MNVVIWDDFVKGPLFDKWEKEVRELEYAGEVNPVDGVEYPDVSTKVNPTLLRYCMARCSRILGKRVVPNTAFLRLTCESTGTAPHQAHNDADMGDYTFCLYWQDGPGGTAFLYHKDGWAAPETEAEVVQWKTDTNNYLAWDEFERVEMARNRATLFDSRIMHRAEPVHGFGKDASDGRIVLTVFLDIQEN